MKSSNVLIADIDTKNFQRKLRAIAKHTEALADELDQIDQIDRETCPECGSSEVKLVKAYGNEGKVEEVGVSECFACEYGKYG